MTDHPILDRFKSNHPVLGGALDWFGNYARKASGGGVLAGGGLAAVLVPLLNSLPEGALEGFWAQIVTWHPILQVIFFSVVAGSLIFAIVFWLANSSREPTE